MNRFTIHAISRKGLLHCVALCCLAGACYAAPSARTAKPWVIGPFTRPVERPIIKPTAELVFDCPMKKQPIRWAENHTFNPAAIVYQVKIRVLFRAEDGRGDRVGGFTSRIGDAVSIDGINFELQPEPLIYPAEDKWVGDEWYGGCEDPRSVESEDGLFAIYYTMYNRDNPKGQTRSAKIGVATSRDFRNWQKHGPILARKDGRMKPESRGGTRPAGWFRR